MMRKVLFCLLMLAGPAPGLAGARADEAPKGASLERTDAFDKAYAASFYEFDACGDGIAGRIYRSALTAKLRACPFSAGAKQRFRTRSVAQQRKSRDVMAKLIEDNGGLPVRLEGMTRTCHEQFDSPEYRQVRGRLDDYAAGKVGPDAVVTAGCDAVEIRP
jgi:hypothetical protein